MMSKCDIKKGTFLGVQNDIKNDVQKYAFLGD